MHWRTKRSSGIWRSASEPAPVKIPDANVLIYAVDETSVHHVRARSWLEDALSGAEPVGLSWTVLLAFLRLSTRPAIFVNPLSPEEAFDLAEEWLAQPSVVVLHPTSRHLSILRGVMEPLGTAGNLTSDGHLAALAIEYGAEVCSADSDFARFRGVRWTNPFA